MTFLADGDRHEVDTTAATLLGALEQAKLTVSETDRVSVDLTTAPQPDQVITITRVTGKQSVDEKSLPFATVSTQSGDLYKGQTKVLEAGKVGVRTLTYADTYTDGKLTTHTLVSDVVTKAPQSRVVLVGTKARPAPAPTARCPVPPGSTGPRWPAASPAATPRRSTRPATTASTSSA